MLLALGFPKPPDNITVLQLWDKVVSKVQELQTRAPANLLGNPLMSKQVLTNHNIAVLTNHNIAVLTNHIAGADS